MSRPEVGLGVFVWKNGKFLMGKRVSSHGHGTWSVPGGYLESGESWEKCAKREVLEETGMTIKNVRFLVATNNIFPSENKHTVTIWVFSDWESGEPKITEPDKYVDHQWHTFKTLPKPLFEPCWENLRKAKPKLFK